MEPAADIVADEWVALTAASKRTVGQAKIAAVREWP